MQVSVLAGLTRILLSLEIRLGWQTGSPCSRPTRFVENDVHVPLGSLLSRGALRTPDGSQEERRPRDYEPPVLRVLRWP